MPWNLIHAKVAAAFASGVLASLVIALFTALGHPLATDAAAAVTTLVATLGGYLMPAGSVTLPVSKPTVVPPAPPLPPS